MLIFQALLAGACSGVVVILVTLIFATVLYMKVRSISGQSKRDLKTFLSTNPTQFQGSMHFACSDCDACKKKMDNIMLSLGRDMSINPSTLLENAAGIKLDFASKAVTRQSAVQEVAAKTVTEVYATPQVKHLPDADYSKFTSDEKQEVYDQAASTKQGGDRDYGVITNLNADSLYDRVGLLHRMDDKTAR